jgi:flavin-binding protein dodecin
MNPNSLGVLQNCIEPALLRVRLILRRDPAKPSSECFMDEHIYKQIELTGSAKTSMEDAIQNAITKASQTLHNLHWFQVVDTRGYIENGKVDYWQVTIKLGFRIDD